jgi:hypothetical protein
MRKTNKRRAKMGKHVSYLSKKASKKSKKSKKIFSLAEKTTEPNIMVNHSNNGGIISGLRAYLGEKKYLI